MPRFGRLSCLELGTFDALSLALFMPRVGHLCSELGTSHASIWALLMHRVGHLSCLDLGAFHVLE